MTGVIGVAALVGGAVTKIDLGNSAGSPGNHPRNDSEANPATGPVASARVRVARFLAEDLLIGCGDRWAHTVGVAKRAAELTTAVGVADRDVLLVAAWLHDIGYSPRVVRTGFHPLDGALYLQERGWPARICALVAHHSGARFLAPALHLADELAAFPDERSAVSDALTYADQTTGTQGRPMPMGERIADMLRRHGPQSVNALVHHDRGPHLYAAARRVERRLGERHRSIPSA